MTDAQYDDGALTPAAQAAMRAWRPVDASGAIGDLSQRSWSVKHSLVKRETLTLTCNSMSQPHLQKHQSIPTNLNLFVAWPLIRTNTNPTSFYPHVPHYDTMKFVLVDFVFNDNCIQASGNNAT